MLTSLDIITLHFLRTTGTKKGEKRGRTRGVMEVAIAAQSVASVHYLRAVDCHAKPNKLSVH